MLALAKLAIACASLQWISVATLTAVAWTEQDAAGMPQEEDETFFSGTVEECSAESVTVSREILGKPAQLKTFTINPQTSIEGKLAEGFRVTVKFRIADDGLIAETIIVREMAKKKKP